jgi:exodeoxyribonuclease VII small subunit
LSIVLDHYRNRLLTRAALKEFRDQLHDQLHAPHLVKMFSMTEPQAEPKPAETFEASLDELEKVVKQLESGDLSLERSIELFERGVNLSDACRKQLEDAETRVEMLIRKEGKIAAEPFRPEKSEKA